MLREILSMAKVSEVKVDPASYNAKIYLNNPLNDKELSYLTGVIEGAHPDEVVSFKYDHKHFSIKELDRIQGKKGELEIKVTAAKSEDWVNQKYNNNYANLCFNAILELFGNKLEK